MVPKEDQLAMKVTVRRADLLFQGSIKDWFVVSKANENNGKGKYSDVSVSGRALSRLDKDMKRAQGMARYGRYKAWLHYANLKRWQEQGLHFRYLNDSGKNYVCTCGLLVPIGLDPDLNVVADLGLDEVHVAFGHKNLPSLRGQTTVFIYNFLWVEDPGAKHFSHGNYHFSAFCQVCLEHVKDVPVADADAFVAAHKKRCKLVGHVGGE